MKIEDVLKKLKKLKKLYEGAKQINSEGEAAAAASAIQRLLVEYNLSMEEVESSISKDERKDGVEEQQTSGYNYKSIGGQWEYRLAYVICKYNFCKCFQYGNSYKNLMIIGKPENLETVKWLKNMLAERFVEISNKKWKEYKLGLEYLLSGCKISKDRFQRSFLMGCVAGLDVRMKEMAERDVDYSNKVTALTVCNNAAIDEFIANKYNKVKYRRATAGGDTEEARHMGYKEGRNTDIYKPISENRRSNTLNVKL
jgi:hypothetical protein